MQKYFLPQVIVLNIFLKMLPSTIFVITGYDYDILVLTPDIYSEINLWRLFSSNKCLKPIPLLAI